MRIEQHLELEASRAIREALSVDAPAVIRGTADPNLGDYQLNGLLPLAKKLGKPPRELAPPVIAALLSSPSIEAAEVAGPGFINVRLRTEWMAAQLTDDLRDARDGVPFAHRREKIVVDFSGPNIAKQMHVGHLRSTILGDAIVRMLRFVGHDVIGDNHLGDWGTQFGLLIVGMRKFGSEEALEQSPIEELERVYRLATAAAESDPDVAAQSRAELAKLQKGDPENHALWKRFVDTTRHTLETIYAELGVTFDVWLGESAYEAMLPGVVSELTSRQIAREDDGAICVFFTDLESASPKLRKQKEPLIVQKRDGAFLYATTDLATLLYRRDQFSADRAIYVVDHRQSLHFEQLFAVAKALGITMRLEHMGFGSVLGENGKPLKTREGKAITLASLLTEAKERALTRIQEEGLEVSESEAPAIARAVGIGAVKYADLRQNRTSDYVFDWDKMISFRGNAGPYLQYAYARTQAIFRKGNIDAGSAQGPIVLREPSERALALALLRFGDVVHAAAETCQPHLVCDHIYAVAREFSSFYEACPVLKSEGETLASRLGLCALAGRQLSRGLGLLGIQAIDRM